MCGGVSSDMGIPQWQASQEAVALGPGQEDLCDKLLRIVSGGEVQGAAMPGTSSYGGIKQPQLPGGRMAAEQRDSSLMGPWALRRAPSGSSWMSPSVFHLL